MAAVRGRLSLSVDERRDIVREAKRLAAAVRAESIGSLRAEAFLQRYSLSTREGVVLMCLAEALLRLGLGLHHCTFRPMRPAMRLRWICDVPAATVAARESRK